jgi:hypothetical protein
MQEINGRYKVQVPCPDGRADCGVCHYALLDVDAFNQIHDRYYDYYGRIPSELVVAQVYKQLPKDIHELANQWGWNDTEVREKIGIWFR